MRPFAFRCGCLLGLRRRMERRQLLEAVATSFVADGCWPDAREVSRRLAGVGLSVDIASLLPAKLGRVNPDGRVVLSVAALRRVPVAADAVQDFSAAARLAARRFRDLRADLEITVADLAIELSLSPLRASVALALLEAEGLVRATANGGGPAEIVCDPSQAADPARAERSSSSRVTGLRDWLGRREHTTRDLIAIAFLAGVFVLVIAAVPQALDRAPPGPAGGRKPPARIHLKSPRSRGRRPGEAPRDAAQPFPANVPVP